MTKTNTYLYEDAKGRTRQRIVILSGPDRCGKTHIAKELARRSSCVYYKASGEHGNFLSQQSKFLNDLHYADPARLDLIKQSNMSIVFDRGYPCEWVYSRFFGRPTDDSMTMWLDEQYAALGTIIVITQRKSFSGIQDDLNPNIGEEQLNRLASLYDEFSRVTKCRVLKLYVDDEDLNREVNEIIKFVKGDSK